ncbi:MAG: BlaI/MecI/CopY family transcriptional regulator [Clostridia bacterium]|nr:BlaI/MecI/CopY family transcriptional regulator [Clostridia bacterium]
MTFKKLSIGDAELEIMKALWESNEPVNTQYISEAVESKGWKRTTISTFLTRLVEKGAISSEKRGKLYYYSPLISQKDYRKSQTKNLISSLYNGSVKEFAVSLFEEQALSDEDLKELRAIFEEPEE